MNLTPQEYVSFAEECLKKYNILDWKIKISKRLTRSLGNCSYYIKTINLSLRYLKYGKESAIYDTILHEIAHIIAPFDRRHGMVWKKACIQIGAKPIKCKSYKEVWKKTIV